MTTTTRSRLRIANTGPWLVLAALLWLLFDAAGAQPTPAADGWSHAVHTSAAPLAPRALHAEACKQIGATSPGSEGALVAIATATVYRCAVRTDAVPATETPAISHRHLFQNAQPRAPPRPRSRAV